MLFISFEYLFLFLPVAVVVFYLLGRRSPQAAKLWLIAASVFFYGWWNAQFVLLLLASVLFNHGIATLLDSRPRPWFPRRAILVSGIVVDLALLGYFKYADFFIGTMNHTGAVQWSTLNVLLPLGISFFTFTQITYLVDLYKGVARREGLANYALFVTYFPHLIAGPVLHYGQIMPQFRNAANYRVQVGNVAVGVALISIGLVKKIFLADALSPYATATFLSAAKNTVPAASTAWSGVLAYAFQLYFDFSGYCDMAIGSARVLNVRMPDNFDSPYKAASLIDFWRRWHMTLSNFLRDYIYIPLGGGRRGGARKYVNLFVTLFLGGMWHGAGWKYLLWGAYHGMLLCLNHLWRTFVGRAKRPGPSWAAYAGVPLTFLVVVLGWVFFRSHSVPSAVRMFKGMFSISGWVPVDTRLAALLIASAAIVWFAPNSGRIARYLEDTGARPATIRDALFGGACALALLAGVAVQFGARVDSPFLYFQF